MVPKGLNRTGLVGYAAFGITNFSTAVHLSVRSKFILSQRRHDDRHRL